MGPHLSPISSQNSTSQQVIGNSNSTSSSSSGLQKKKRVENEELVKYMSNLPSYLEKGVNVRDKALNFGVMDWGRLEKWHYSRKQVSCKSSRCSPSTSNSSSFFSTDASPPSRSSRAHSCSPARQKFLRQTLESQFKESPNLSSIPFSGCENLSNFRNSENNPDSHLNRCKKPLRISEPSPRNRLEVDAIEGKGRNAAPPQVIDSKFSQAFRNGEVRSSSKGKMKIQDIESSEGQNHEFVRVNPSQVESASSPSIVPPSVKRPTCPSLSTNQKEEHCAAPSKGENQKMDSVAALNKARSISPLHRMGISMSKIARSSTSRDKFVNSTCGLDKTVISQCPDLENTSKENPKVSNKSRSSPLRRLLDPLLSKAANSNHTSDLSHNHSNSKTKAKGKLDFGSCKEIDVNDSSSCKNEKITSSSVQAFLQLAVKNGRPLFTFAVENNSDIIAATVKSLSSSTKDGNEWIYTFLTVHEVTRKKGNWINQSRKGKKVPNFVPNVVAQMKVSDFPILNWRKQDCNDQFRVREFVLFPVDSKQSEQQMNNDHYRPRDELAAIVVKFYGKGMQGEDSKGDCVGNEENLFSATVILPGGDHGVPSKGEPSPLIQRWRSGGLCDCGGWDVGCRMRILANRIENFWESDAVEAHLSIDRFDLFPRGEFAGEKPFFSLSPLKEGIFSIEYNSSISLIQAFSVCVSILDSREPPQLSECLRDGKMSEETAVSKNDEGFDAPDCVAEEGPVRYASNPPLSPVGRV